MTDTFTDNWEFQARFRSHFMEIAQKVVPVQQASWELDIVEAIDFQTLSVPGKKLTARARRYGSNWFPSP